MNNGISQAKKFDKLYTPRYGVLPILEFIHKNMKIILPFDTEQSEFYKVLKEKGYQVWTGHMKTGQDFFEGDYSNYHIIISNPPYSIKDKVLKKLYDIGKPFMMLLPVTALSSKRRFGMFSEHGIELLVFDKRINFTGNSDRWFSTAYFCWKVLPEPLMFRRLEVEK